MILDDKKMVIFARTTWLDQGSQWSVSGLLQRDVLYFIRFAAGRNLN